MPSRKYQCCRCGYETNNKSNMVHHFKKRVSMCAAVLENIELTDEIKEYILRNRIYKAPPPPPAHVIKIEAAKEARRDKLEETIKKLTEEVNELKIKLTMMTANKKNEEFYQMIVEKHLGGTHKRLECGITDITTSNIHAEVKCWDRFNDVYGQLIRYNNEDPKDRLQVYMFGTTTKKIMKHAVAAMKSVNFEVYTFIHYETHVDIVKYETNEVVYTFSL